MAGSKKTLSIEMVLRDFASKNMDKIRGKAALMAAKMVKVFKKIISPIKRVIAAVTSLKSLMVGFLAVLAVRRVASFALGLVEAEDKLSKMARSVQSTTEELSALQFAFERSGLEIQKVEILLTGFGRARSQAFRADLAGRANDQVKSFKALGVSIDDLKNKGLVEIFGDLADGLERVSEIKGQTALQALFPDNFLKLFPLLAEGGDNFRRLIADAERFGAVVSTKAGRAAEKFVDTMTNFKAAISGTFRELANRFLPDIQRVIEGLTDAVLENKEAFIALITGVFSFIKGIAEATFANIVITFEGIASLIGRTRGEVLAELEAAKVELSKVNRNTRVSSKAQLEELTRRRKEGAKLVEALELELATFKDLDTEVAKLNERLRDFRDAALAGTGAVQTVEMAEGFRLTRIAAESVKDEITQIDVEGRKLIETMRALEAAAPNFIGPLRPGQKETPFGDVPSQASAVGGQFKGPPTFPFAPAPPAPGGKGPTDLVELQEKAKDLQKTLDDLSLGEGFQQGILDATRNLDSLGEAGAEFAASLKDGLVNAMDDFVSKTLTAKEAVKEFARVMLRQLARIISELTIASALQSSLTDSGSTKSSSNPSGGLPALQAAAGAVFPGRLQGLSFAGGFSGGGIVPARPQLALVGEGGRREAVVPLKNNRSIPVDLRGDGGATVTQIFNFHGTTREAKQDVQKNVTEIAKLTRTAIESDVEGIRRTIQEISR